MDTMTGRNLTDVELGLTPLLIETNPGAVTELLIRLHNQKGLCTELLLAGNAFAVCCRDPASMDVIRTFSDLEIQVFLTMTIVGMQKCLGQSGRYFESQTSKRILRKLRVGEGIPAKKDGKRQPSVSKLSTARYGGICPIMMTEFSPVCHIIPANCSQMGDVANDAFWMLITAIFGVRTTQRIREECGPQESIKNLLNMSPTLHPFWDTAAFLLYPTADSINLGDVVVTLQILAIRLNWARFCTTTHEDPALQAADIVVPSRALCDGMKFRIRSPNTENPSMLLLATRAIIHRAARAANVVKAFSKFMTAADHPPTNARKRLAEETGGEEEDDCCGPEYKKEKDANVQKKKRREAPLSSEKKEEEDGIENWIHHVCDEVTDSVADEYGDWMVVLREAESEGTENYRHEADE